MAFYVFDFDGTLAEITHRRHLVEINQWDAFFEACDLDLPIPEVIGMAKILLAAGHRVEIWSGRSASVEEKSRVWLRDVADLDPDILKRMRPVGDFQPDDKLKLAWLKEERALGAEPVVIFDDRQKVVDMWRANGVPCFQVNPGDFDKPKSIRPYGLYGEGGVPLVTLLIGPAGAGKSTFAEENFEPQTVISADTVRKLLTGSSKDQSRNAATFVAIHHLLSTRIAMGLPTVIDATNVRRKDRVALASLAAGHKVAYVVIHRPLSDMLASGGERLEVEKAHGREVLNLIEKHEAVFQANLKFIKAGDGLEHVEVFLNGADYIQAIKDRGAAYSAALALEAAQVAMGVSQGV